MFWLWADSKYIFTSCFYFTVSNASILPSSFPSPINFWSVWKSPGAHSILSLPCLRREIRSITFPFRTPDAGMEEWVQRVLGPGPQPRGPRSAREPRAGSGARPAELPRGGAVWGREPPPPSRASPLALSARPSGAARGSGAAVLMGFLTHKTSRGGVAPNSSMLTGYPGKGVSWIKLLGNINIGLFQSSFASKLRNVCYLHVVQGSQLDINLKRVTPALLVMFICNSYTLAIMCRELILPCLENRAFT